MKFKIEKAFYKVAINDIERPERNHPIHDSTVVFEYAKKRFIISVVFDGVSESKEKTKNSVNISKDLEWDLEMFCRENTPEDINDIAKWFIDGINKEKYNKKGATTISLLRFDTENETIDGFTVGDSPALLARRVSIDDNEFIEATILTEFDSVINDPGVITQQWKFDTPVKIAPFKAQLPSDYKELFLVCMSDGFGKLSDKDTLRFIDDDLQDRKASQYFPYFARVYPPSQVINKFPQLKPDSNGSVSILAISGNSDIQDFISDIYPSLSANEQSKLSMVDLDTVALYDFFTSPEDYAAGIGKDVQTILNESHSSLRWMLNGVYNDSKDEFGLDEYLREYIKAELFTVSMLEELDEIDSTSDSSLQHRLKLFFKSLDPIGDDFSISLISIIKYYPPID